MSYLRSYSQVMYKSICHLGSYTLVIATAHCDLKYGALVDDYSCQGLALGLEAGAKISRLKT